jgi:hypothetical protein
LFLVCGARFVIIILETNINPLKNIFDNFVFLLTCFVVLYLCLFINVLHHA